MYTNDITKIDPPANLTELAALDATRETPYLKARCNRMRISVPLPNPTPFEIIPHVQRALTAHLKDPVRDAGPMSGDYMEWKLIREEYEEFIAYLKSLALSSSSLCSPSIEPLPSSAAAAAHPSLAASHPCHSSHPPHVSHVSRPSHSSPCTSPFPPVASPGTKPGQNRDRTGTQPGTPQISGTQPGQNRDEPGMVPGQHREIAEDAAEISLKIEENLRESSLLPALLPENTQSTSRQHASDNASDEPTDNGIALRIDNAPDDLDAIAASIDKLNLTQIVDTAIKMGFLPDPKNCELTEYAGAFLEWAGPPRRTRLDQLDPKIRAFILGLLEDASFVKVQGKLMLPPPFGPYIQTSKSSLGRFKTSEHTREARRSQRALKKHVTAIINAPNISQDDCAAVTENLLRARLVENSLHPDPDLTRSKTLVDMLEKIRAGKLAERKLQLAESKQ